MIWSTIWMSSEACIAMALPHAPKHRQSHQQLDTDKRILIGNFIAEMQVPFKVGVLKIAETNPHDQAKPVDLTALSSGNSVQAGKLGLGFRYP